MLVIVNAAERFAPGQQCVHARLAADFGRAAEHGDAVPARRRDPGGLEAGDAGADHHHALLPRRARRPPVHLVGLADARVVVAGERQAQAGDAFPAGVARHAVADIVRAPGHRLVEPGGIGRERAPEPDQFRVTAREQSLRLGRVGDAPQRHHRHAVGGAAQFAHQRHVGHARRMAVGDVLFERVGMAAVGEADVVDVAECGEVGGDCRRFLRSDAARDPVVAGKLEADDEAAATGGADGGDQLGDDARAARQIAAVAVAAPVGARRQKLVEQVPVAGGDFDAAEAAALQPRRRVGHLLDHAGDLVDAELARHAPAQVVGQHRRTGGIGCAPRDVAATAAVDDLPEQAAILRLDRLGPAGEAVEVVVVPGADARGHVKAAPHAQRLGHDHRRAAPGAAGVIVHQPLGDARACGELGGNRRMHDAVAQPLPRQRKRRRHRRVGRHVHQRAPACKAIRSALYTGYRFAGDGVSVGSGAHELDRRWHRRGLPQSRAARACSSGSR